MAHEMKQCVVEVSESGSLEEEKKKKKKKKKKSELSDPYLKFSLHTCSWHDRSPRT